MKILSLNPGSTSLKSALYSYNNGNIKEICVLEDRKTFHEHIEFYREKRYITGLEDIHHFGIRVVHGGGIFGTVTRIDDTVLTQIKNISALAPLHNPPAVELIEYIRKNSSHSIWAVFDTAFHKTIPAYIAHYPIDKAITNPIGLRKYGFHGIAISSLLRNISYKKSKIIFCHLGGGCSVTAVKDGISLNNSMGFTPLNGVMMVARSGTINAGAYVYLKEKMHMNDEECLYFLNHNAGLSGYTKNSNIKNIFDIASQNPLSKEHEIVQMFVHNVCEYIWNYYGLLQGVDMIVFSGGIGRNNSYAREQICKQLSILGVEIEKEKNISLQKNGGIISKDISPVTVLVMKTNETREIAMQIGEAIEKG